MGVLLLLIKRGFTVGHLAIKWVERGYLPDWLIRLGIRALLKRRLRAIDSDDAERFGDAKQVFITRQNEAPIALQAEAANQQHYELPAEFFSRGFGPAPQVQLWPLARY